MKWVHVMFLQSGNKHRTFRRHLLIPQHAIWDLRPTVSTVKLSNFISGSRYLLQAVRRGQFTLRKKNKTDVEFEDYVCPMSVQCLSEMQGKGDEVFLFNSVGAFPSSRTQFHGNWNIIIAGRRSWCKRNRSCFGWNRFFNGNCAAFLIFSILSSFVSLCWPLSYFQLFCPL